MWTASGPVTQYEYQTSSPAGVRISQSLHRCTSLMSASRNGAVAMCTSPGSTACDASAGSMMTGRSGGVFAKADTPCARTPHPMVHRANARVNTDIDDYAIRERLRELQTRRHGIVKMTFAGDGLRSEEHTSE